MSFYAGGIFTAARHAARTRRAMQTPGPKLHPFQSSTLQELARPRAHVICVAPTGSGKSLIFERHVLETRARTLIVTPLVALARQQRARLERQGIRVHLSSGEARAGMPGASSEVWIASPETLIGAQGKAALARWRPQTLVVDECHCLWEWGERFRPAFRELPRLLNSGLTRSLWLTATLPPVARTQLRMLLPEPCVEIGEFDLPPRLGLRVRRVPWSDRASAMISFASHRGDRGIVFVSTRASAERVARLLNATLGPSTALAYHGGLSTEERRALESGFRTEQARILVATCAYGMGMDNEGLGWVALWQAPTTLLALAQMIGRVGRAGNAGQALVLWDNDDFALNDWAEQDFAALHDFLNTRACRLALLRGWFAGIGAPEEELCYRCDFCIEHVNLYSL